MRNLLLRWKGSGLPTESVEKFLPSSSLLKRFLVESVDWFDIERVKSSYPDEAESVDV